MNTIAKPYVELYLNLVYAVDDATDGAYRHLWGSSFFVELPKGDYIRVNVESG